MRPMLRNELEQWNNMMARDHYLGFQALIGEAMRYVAVVGEKWVALIGWNWAALKNRHRDLWIGWDKVLQQKRLRFVVNNARFLILPEVGKVKNLASKILTLNLRRLSLDWEKRHGHPVLLAETFVDLSRFRGSCYLACGWKMLGETRGYGKRHDGYVFHNNPKAIFVKPLIPLATQILSSPFTSPFLRITREATTMIDINQLPIQGEGGLIDVLGAVKDPRKPRGTRHKSSSILALSTGATLSGARSFQAIWEWGNDLSEKALRALGFRRGKPPSESAIRRLLQKVDAEEVDQKVGSWLLSQQPTLSGKGIAIDGKTLRGGYDGEQKAPHLISAVLHNEGIVLAQKSVGEKTNEIPMLQPLLKDVDITGAVVTTDAMHTQTKSARFIVEEKKSGLLDDCERQSTWP